MGRGLGDRQREILERLDRQPGYYVPLHELVGNPDDRNEMAKARSAVRALERRGLVITERMADPSKLIHTTTIMATVGGDWSVSYHAEPNERVWFGLHVCRRKPAENRASLALRLLEEDVVDSHEE